MLLILGYGAIVDMLMSWTTGSLQLLGVPAASHSLCTLAGVKHTTSVNTGTCCVCIAVLPVYVVDWLAVSYSWSL